MKIIIKKIEKGISIFHDDQLIENYLFDKEIDFNLFYNFLIKNEFSNKITIEEDTSSKFSENDNELITVLNSIISDYNEKFDEYELFKIQNK